LILFTTIILCKKYYSFDAYKGKFETLHLNNNYSITVVNYNKWSKYLYWGATSPYIIITLICWCKIKHCAMFKLVMIEWIIRKYWKKPRYYYYLKSIKSYYTLYKIMFIKYTKCILKYLSDNTKWTRILKKIIVILTFKKYNYFKMHWIRIYFVINCNSLKIGKYQKNVRPYFWKVFVK